MKTTHRTKGESLLQRAAIPLIFLIFLAQAAMAQLPPGYTPPPTPLDSWSFTDNTNWTDDNGDLPISFTNISYSNLGDGSSLVVDTNVPAWVNYAIVYPPKGFFDGYTNLVVDGPGSVTLWFGPNWTTTNGGPGDWAQLIDVGEWTSNSSYGYWGLSIDPPASNILFLAQDGLGDSYGLSAPINWTTNYFHFIALTYSSTNVSLYLDGVLETNDPGGLSIWPDSNVLSGGVYFGSDTNGNYQADGLFSDVATYDFPLGSNTVNRIYNSGIGNYELNPVNAGFMGALSSGPSNPSTGPSTTNAITGAGFLQWDGTNANCAYSTNGWTVWLTNIVVTPSSNGLMNVTFSIDGGTNGWFYDVFAIGQLAIPPGNGTWSWMGQGLACNTYTIPNVNTTDCFLMLGTPQDSYDADLTDAYQLLVSKTNPDVQDSDDDGLITGWEILLGLNPHQSNINSQSQRSNYSYTSADWLSGVSGIRTGSITNDPEGNVLSVSE